MRHQPADNGKISLPMLFLLTEFNWENVLAHLVEKLNEINQATNGCLLPDWYKPKGEDKHFVFEATIHQFPEGHPRRRELMIVKVDISFTPIFGHRITIHHHGGWLNLTELPVTGAELLEEAESYCRRKLKDKQRCTTRLLPAGANRLEPDMIERFTLAMMPFMGMILTEEASDFLKEYADYIQTARLYEAEIPEFYTELVEKIDYELDRLAVADRLMRRLVIRALPHLLREKYAGRL